MVRNGIPIGLRQATFCIFYESPHDWERFWTSAIQAEFLYYVKVGRPTGKILDMRINEAMALNSILEVVNVQKTNLLTPSKH